MNRELYDKFLNSIERVTGMDRATIKRMDVSHQRFYNLHREEMRVRNNGVENEYIFIGRKLIYNYSLISGMGFLQGVRNFIYGSKVVSESEMDDYLSRINFRPKFKITSPKFLSHQEVDNLADLTLEDLGLEDLDD